MGAQKLTDWKLEPDLASMKQDLFGAKTLRDDYVLNVRRWLDQLHIKGTAKLTPVRGRSSVQPKLIRKQAEWRYSSLSEPFLSSSKLFTVKPRSWEDQAAAEQGEMLINWQFSTKLNSTAFVDRYVRTGVDQGTIGVRVGWERETKRVKVKAPVYSYYQATQPEEVEQINQAGQLQINDPAQFKTLDPALQESVRFSMEQGSPHIARKTGEQDVWQEKVVCNKPTAEVINLANLLVDPSCQGDPDKAMFMGFTSEVTRGSLMRDKRYKNLERVNWASNSPLSEPDHTTNTPAEFNFKDNSRQLVTLTEYWGLWDMDGDGHMTAIHACWVGDTLIRLEENVFPDKRPPFVIVPYLPVDGSIYGEPDGELLGDNQKITGALTRGFLDLLARSANSQRGMAKNMLDVVNKRRFDAGQDYEFNPNVHPSQGVVEHKFPELPVSAMNLLQMTNMDAESLVGVKAFAEGLTGASLGPTAAGAKGALGAASKREMGILRRLAKGMAQIGTKISMMNQEFLSEEEVIRVTNDKFVTVKKDELHGNFDMEVDISTVEEDEAKASRLEFMLQTMGNTGDPAVTKMILVEIARLRRMPALAHEIKTYEPQPDPVQQKMQELEAAKIEAEIQKLRAQAASDQAQAALDQARARQINSTADLQDLDFVERDTGTTHARRMEEIGAQGHANAKAKITEGILGQRNGTTADGKVDSTPTRSDIADAIAFNGNN